MSASDVKKGKGTVETYPVSLHCGLQFWNQAQDFIVSAWALALCCLQAASLEIQHTDRHLHMHFLKKKSLTQRSNIVNSKKITINVIWFIKKYLVQSHE